MIVLKPRQPVPNLAISTLDGEWLLSKSAAENFTMIVFYRGLHCPICSKYIKELDKMVGDFAAAGIEVIAISSDDQARVEQTREDWELQQVTLGYGLSVEQAREWGLHRSTSRGMTSIGIMEPDTFSEPGLFIVKPDQTLYWSQISTMPFARPHFREILVGMKFALENDYPARGELD